MSLNAPQLTAASSSLGGDSHLGNAQETTSQQAKMFLRVDKLQFEQPVPEEANPNAAAAVQDLMGGKFGEISTLMNYMFQSFNFRNRENLKPYYDLIANITAEELGHVELISARSVHCRLAPTPSCPKRPSIQPAHGSRHFKTCATCSTSFLAGWVRCRRTRAASRGRAIIRNP